MARSSKKPRHKKLDPRQVPSGEPSRKKPEKDWGFDEIRRSKPARR